MHLVKIACERPDEVGRSLSHWDCTALARQLAADAVVESISPQTVQRMLASGSPSIVVATPPISDIRRRLAARCTGN